MVSRITKDNRIRANYAFTEVNQFLKETKEKYKVQETDDEDTKKKKKANYQNSIKKYKSYTRRIPTLIMNNGLLATLLFIKPKDEEYKKIYKSIYGWIICKYQKKQLEEELEDDFIQNITKINDAEYRIITNEVLQFMVWMKRFASNIDYVENN